MRFQASAVLLLAGVFLYFAGVYGAANPLPNRRPPDHSIFAMLFSAVMMVVGTIGVIRAMWEGGAGEVSPKPMQFGLGSLMMLILILAILFGYVVNMQRVEAARRAAANQELQRFAEGFKD